MEVGGWGEWWGRWAAGGGLFPLLGMFGLAMTPRSASHRPNKLRGPKSHLTTTGKIHAFHVVSSMGPIVSIVTLYGWQNLL